MAKRFFTADFHLGMDSIIEFENRPFSNVGEMNSALIAQCEGRTKAGDVIIHVGDLACFRPDNHAGRSDGTGIRPDEMLKNVKADFVNVRGNHDVNNRVRSVCESMTVRLGQKYPNVVVGHYPSYDPRAAEYVRDGWICLCGHVHGRWRHCIDMNRKILNVNVGVDAWDYRLVTEDELCRYIGRLLTHRPDSLYRCFMSKGKLRFQGEKEII